MDPPARFRIDGSSLFLFSLGIDCPVCAFFESLLRVSVRFGFPCIFIWGVGDRRSFSIDRTGDIHTSDMHKARLAKSS